REREREMCV
ncbi:Protein of unknown function, partial [Gryllus bimaculatus]